MKRLRFFDSSNRRLWLFSSTYQSIELSSLVGLQWTLFLSLKNPAFSNVWIADAVSLCREFSGSLRLFVVDSPHFKILPTISLIRQDIDLNMLHSNLVKHRDEQVQRLQKLASKNFTFTKYAPWERYASIAPPYIATEIGNAFINRDSRVYRLVMEQVKQANAEIVDSLLLMQLAQFFLDEIPVLITVYYSDNSHVIDVYPKKQASFFWALETGMLSIELPQTYSYIRRSKPHVFCSSH